MRVGVFGGSFDPVHLGHLIAAEAAWRALALDHVRLVPTGQQPFKGTRVAAPAADRVAMLRAAVAGDARFVVDEREVRRPGPSYTVDTLRELKAELPGAELFLLVGSDAASELPHWREAAAIPSLAEVVELTRPGTAPVGAPVTTRTLSVPAVDISATVIRDRVRRGDDIRYLVPHPVDRHIAERHLYATEG